MNFADGNYYVIQAKHSGQCLSVFGASTAQGANIIQWPNIGRSEQQFRFQATGDGHFFIIAKHSNQCISVFSAFTTDGANIMQWPNIGRSEQQFRLQPSGDGSFFIIARHSGKGIDVQGRSVQQGANILQWSITGANSQRFSILPVGTTSGGNINGGNTGGNINTIHGSSKIQSYKKLFPQLPANQVDEGTLRQLSGIMRDTSDDPAMFSQNDNPLIPAGYTYLGQFIDHDLTFDTSSVLNVPTAPGDIRNLRTPRLDLDNVYGSGPNDQPYLYELDKTKLKFGSKDNPQGDIQRNEDGVALIGDPRNDENVIVASMQLLFIRFHNQVIEHLRRLQFKQQRVFDDIFEEARRLVRWHYQWIVRNDFLPRIVRQDVINDIFARGPQFYRVNRPNETYIPLEFSGAAYRFGHSMVRDRYDHNRIFEHATLGELFFTFPKGQLQRSITPVWTIDWRRFFEIDPSIRTQRARKFDTKLSAQLFQLLGEKVPSLPFRNLVRGNTYGLASGQDIARTMGVQPLSLQELTMGDPSQTLVRLNLHERTPLWYYILKEAEVRERGERLGMVGSRIVAEVFIGLLQADPDSFVHRADWLPSLGSRSGQFTMVDLINFARPVMGPLS
ncbi:MAG: RICIN domain-containing protein [Xenococcaceae cyanobacterium]